MTTNVHAPGSGYEAEAYKGVLADAGLALVSEYRDEGGNHYYDSGICGSFED